MKGSGELYLSILRRIIGCETESITCIDLCCGEMTLTRTIPFKSSLHVDVVDWPTRPANFDFVEGDALCVASHVPDKSYDLALCSDGIEHLTRHRGLELLGEMERIAKLAMIFTPMDEMCMDPSSDNPDVHKSLWNPEEFISMGWQVESHTDWHSEWNIGAFFAWKGKI